MVMCKDTAIDSNGFTPDTSLQRGGLYCSSSNGTYSWFTGTCTPQLSILPRSPKANRTFRVFPFLRRNPPAPCLWALHSILASVEFRNTIIIWFQGPTLLSYFLPFLFVIVLWASRLVSHTQVNSLQHLKRPNDMIRSYTSSPLWLTSNADYHT